MFRSAVMVEWLEHKLPGRRPGFAPQAALLAVRRIKLVAPPYGSSIARLHYLLSSQWSAPHVKSNMIEASDLVWLTSSSYHAINGGSVFCESYPQAR